MLKTVAVSRSLSQAQGSHGGNRGAEIKEAQDICGRLDEASKKGPCWSELKRSGMMQWGVCQRVLVGGTKHQVSSSIVKEEDVKVDEEEEAVTADSLVVTQVNRKRNHTGHNQTEDARASTREKKMRITNCTKRKQIKLENSKDRWSAERYKLAEKTLFAILKDEGAVFMNKVSRPALRTAARKCIGDTGLLDHLLKHIDGEITPSGTERFRRWHNTNGIMEYWLENADLVNIRREAGVQDPYWIPPSWWKPGGGPSHEPIPGRELDVLKEEIAKMKRDMEELLSEKQERVQENQTEGMHTELVKLKAKTEENLLEISSSLKSMQDMYKEVITWKAKIEQQLVVISDSLSSMQVSKQYNSFSTGSEIWESWLDGTSLDNIPGEDLAPWLASTDLVNAEQQAAVALPPQSKSAHGLSEDPVVVRDLELLKEEMAKIKRDVQELVSHRREEDQMKSALDSSATTNSKLDLDNSLLLFQEMFKELVKWKAKMEQQMIEMSNTVNGMRASYH